MTAAVSQAPPIPKPPTAFHEDVHCVIRPGSTDSQMQGAIGWICSVIDCSDINPGGSDFLPNTLYDHTAWGVDRYYQQNDISAITTCDFSGLAMIQCPDNSGPRLLQPRIIGVNLGGFLLLEPFITPSLFQQFVNRSESETAIDEYTFCKVLGKEEATRQLTAHWNAWVTDDRIAQLAKLGITHVRIPFGYWVFGDVEPFVRGIEQLDRAVDLCAKYGLKVLLDLHGAEGSQNGFDNSGRMCNIINPNKTCFVSCPAEPMWGKDADGGSVNRTLQLIDRVLQRYQNSTAVWGFELLNEPRLINSSVLKDFYTRGYDLVRQYRKDWFVVVHDAFYPLSWWNFMTPAQGFQRVLLDTHIYESFGGDNNGNYEQHKEEACGYTKNIDYMLCNEMPLIVGEFSLAPDDCALWVNGFGLPSTSKMCPERPPLAPVNDDFMREYAKRQISAFYRSQGFFFWNFDAEPSAFGWSFLEAARKGWLPDLSMRRVDYNTIEKCGYSVVPPMWKALRDNSRHQKQKS